MALWLLATDVGGNLAYWKSGHGSCLTVEQFWGWIMLVCGRPSDYWQQQVDT